MPLHQFLWWELYKFGTVGACLLFGYLLFCAWRKIPCTEDCSRGGWLMHAFSIFLLSSPLWVLGAAGSNKVHDYYTSSVSEGTANQIQQLGKDTPQLWHDIKLACSDDLLTPEEVAMLRSKAKTLSRNSRAMRTVQAISE